MLDPLARTEVTLEPLDDFVVIQPLEDSETATGLIVPINEAAQCLTGIIVAVGPDVSLIEPGDKVHVSGVSKGKGFQGPVHLHHFTRGPKSHGSDHLRRQGSVGSGTTPGRVWKGLRMASHQGANKVTVKNLEILRADADRSLLVIAGAVPGARNGIVVVRKA